MIADPIIIENSKELPVPDFNKKEVEELAKGVCVPRFDILNPLKDLVEVETLDDNLDEIIARGNLPETSNNTVDISDSQAESLIQILRKAASDGKIFYGRYYLFMTFADIYGSYFCICFGCASNNTSGVHVEIEIQEDSGGFHFTSEIIEL